MGFFWLVALGVVGYFVLKAYLRSASSSQPKGTTAGPGRRPRRAGGDIPDWVQERWDMAQRVGVGDMFPAWYFEQMSEYQARRLEEDGRKYSGDLTKGQASDLIGLGEQPDEDDREVLRFFKMPLRGMNETRARHEIALLFQDAANRKAWDDRPATTRQREFFRFFGLKPGVGLLKRDADQQIAERLKQARQSGDPLADQWQTYDAILDDFDDPDFREGYDIRKPGASAVRKAIDALLAEGRTWDDLDSDSVAERLLEIAPNLER